MILEADILTLLPDMPTLPEGHVTVRCASFRFSFGSAL